MSINTRVSSSSTSSRNRRHRQYRTVSDHSQVDETLFGQPNHVQLKQQNRSAGPLEEIQDNAIEQDEKRAGQKPTKEKESVQIIMMDLIRNLVVPDKDPSGRSLVLDPREYSRIKDNARILTDEELRTIEEFHRTQKEKTQKERFEREQFMKKKDLQREKAESLLVLEGDAKANAQDLLSKANESKQEQEQEIKYLNELIREAKCHAIRDAQLEEKKVIKDEMAAEESRLDMMMEVDRQNAIKIQEEIDKNRKMERYMGAEQIKEQILEMKQRKLIDLEAKDAENEMMRKKLAQMLDEDEEQIKKRKQKQIMLRDELKKANEELRSIKMRQQKQEKLEELNVLEFQKQKAEREAQFEAEQEKLRLEKEREIAKLRSMQERARDEQAERDALRAKRAMEEAEREWRKKETSEAKKKSEMEAMLIEARKQQMQEKEHFLAVQAKKERVEFENILRAQKEVMEKEKRDDDVLKSRAMKHSKEIRAQIAAKEKEKINERQAFFAEGRKYMEENKLHRQKIESIKEKKLKELKEAGIPDKYLIHVQREARKMQKI